MPEDGIYYELYKLWPRKRQYFETKRSTSYCVLEKKSKCENIVS